MGKMVPYNGGMTEVRSPYNRIVALVLWWFLGVFGVHRFYVGKVWTGIFFLLTVGFFGFGWAYDGVMLALGRFTDASGAVLGPPQQRKALGTSAPRLDPERQLETDLGEYPDRDVPDVRKEDVERALERDPLEEKFDDLEKELGSK